MLTLDRVSTEKRLSLALLRNGLLTQEQLDEALEESRGQRVTLSDYLLKLELVRPEDLVQELGKVFNLPVVQLHTEQVEPEALTLVPESLARRYNVLPLRLQNDALVLVTADPLNLQAVEDLRAHTRKRILLALATATELQEAIKIHFRDAYAFEQEIDQLLGTSVEDAAVDPALSEAANQTPIVRTVDTLISQAVQDRASDIHIQPQQDKVVVRYRIDGILHQALTLPLSAHAPIIARLKVLAGLNSTEHRHPQDGQLTLKLEGQNVDIRLATAESVYGEAVVLRILNRRSSLLSLPDLGFSPQALEIPRQLLRHPHGMLLLAGPTGAGKTTTLYACLGQLDKSQRNIMTIEDPVEYRFEGITQLQVSARYGISFASGLRATMRLDPDVILVGEIRDDETAQVAVQAALTGHLVLSSIHANDAVGAIFRLLNLGADRFMASAALLGIIAQRMVRKVCQYCAQEQECSLEEGPVYQKVMGEERRRFQYGTGCTFCSNTGFQGRIGIFEVLPASESLQELILHNASASEIRRHCVANGMVTMLQDGMQKAKLGITTPAEVIRHVYSLSSSVPSTNPAFEGTEGMSKELLNRPSLSPPDQGGAPGGMVPAEATGDYPLAGPPAPQPTSNGFHSDPPREGGRSQNRDGLVGPYELR